MAAIRPAFFLAISNQKKQARLGRACFGTCFPKAAPLPVGANHAKPKELAFSQVLSNKGSGRLRNS